MRIDKVNEIYTGAAGRKSVYDLKIPDTWNNEILLFMHGYKGYKDWGAWSLMGSAFTAKKFGYCAFNFSHNGGTVDNPIDFPDLDAFAQNRYSYELHDAHTMVNLLHDMYPSAKIHVIGHSRGGGIASLVAAQTSTVSSLTTLASVDDFASRFIQGEALDKWKNQGVYTVKNSRTQQDMPHYYSFYTDYFNHEKDLNILENLKQFEKPALHIHGTQDEAVQLACSRSLALATKGEFVSIEGAGHTFQSKHPWTENVIPKAMQEMVQHMLNFYK
ncbi:alpha/beta hydrolase [Lishizhenia sp.]|uniref:alpha/beta hydrolase family protein n=1 Tax=Lishizhenia sp. TaxID=2497594 RepID=UPI00299EE6EC|nr:alpha/beta hydrolase [Lishizhenia sp.]MDX1445104.1 alpha/beta hydrolase [Lishizhenia sp.]